MGIGDTMPSGGYRPKKPLSKAQIKKLQLAYAQAGAVSASVKDLEAGEQAATEEEIEKMIGMI